MRLRLMLMVLGVAVAAPECSNPYIDHFRRMVTIYQSPVIIDNVCGGEWKTFGSCCELKAVEDYARKDKAMIEEAVNRVVKTIQTTAQKFIQLFEKSKNFLKKRKPGSELLANAFSDSKLDGFKEDLKSFIKRQDLSSDFNRCWQHMAMIRSRSFCSVCSGRSQNFFSQTQKGIISQDTCSSILSLCSESFSSLVRFIQGLDTFQQSFIEHFGSRRNNLISELQNLDKVTDSIRENKIQETIQSMLQTKDPIEHNNLAKVICEKMVNLMRRTFIEQVNHLLQYNTFMFERLDNIMENKSGARRLLSSGNFNFFSTQKETPKFLQGDIIVVNSGVIVPSMHNQVGMPINLQNKFP